jgi:hypothetical protein
MLWPKPPCEQADKGKQGHGNEEFSLHAPLTASALMAFGAIPAPSPLIP